jgi:hypothetical protein
VFIRNGGRGVAKLIDMTFETTGANVWNESGNACDRAVLDDTVIPPRWHHPTQFLQSGAETAIALLTWYRDSHHPESPALDRPSRAYGQQRGDRAHHAPGRALVEHPRFTRS